MFVLDTHVISELRHGKPRQSPEVRAWAAAQPGSRLFLSAITVLELELEMGAQALERRTPPQGSALRSWLTGVRAAFAGRILPFSELSWKVADTNRKILKGNYSIFTTVFWLVGQPLQGDLPPAPMQLQKMTH